MWNHSWSNGLGLLQFPMSVVRVTSLLFYFSSADVLSFSLLALILWEFFLKHSLDQASVLRFLRLFLMLLCRKTSPSSFWVSCGTHVMGYGSCRTGGYSVGQWTSMVIFSLGFLIKPRVCSISSFLLRYYHPIGNGAFGCRRCYRFSEVTYDAL